MVYQGIIVLKMIIMIPGLKILEKKLKKEGLLNVIMEKSVFILMGKIVLKKIVNADIIKKDKDIVHFLQEEK